VVQLTDAICQRCWTRLKDVRRFDLEDAVVSYGGHVTPARPGHDCGLFHLLPTPRREDHFRIPARDVRGIDDAIFRQAALRQLWENRIASGNLDELFNPPDT
jgi:hypothetical protein